MGVFSETEPAGVVGWSAETTGEWVNMYNQGKYGYAYRSGCSVTRLKDNSLCVRINMYSNAIMGWGATNQATYIPWGYNGESNEFGTAGKYNYGSGGVAGTWYYTLPPSYKGETVKAGMTCGHNATAAKSPVTLAVPEPVGDLCFAKANGVWRQGQMKTKVNGVWTDATAKIRTGGIWK